MTKKKWPDFIHQEVLLTLARTRHRDACRRLFEKHEQLEAAIRKLEDLAEMIGDATRRKGETQ